MSLSPLAGAFAPPVVHASQGGQIPSLAASSVSSGLAGALAISELPSSTAVVKNPFTMSGSPAATSGSPSPSATGQSASGSQSPAGGQPASGASSPSSSTGSSTSSGPTGDSSPTPGNGGGGGGGNGSSPVANQPSSGTITAGDSKTNCITLRFPGGGLNQAQVDAVTAVTGVTYDCLEMFANPMPTWAAWETPWMFSTVGDGFDSWLRASSAHQVVMGMDLIPQSVMNNKDPLTWEQPCAAGDYNAEATTLAQNLVSYGAGNIVIRLGIEANGAWEADFTGTTSTEWNDWARCYDNEVSAMRAVAGTHFLFVWNPNICTRDFPLNQWYPGNSYVDIIGADAYDQDCGTQKTVSQEGWSAYANDSSANTPNDPNFPSLNNIEAFAAANGKPMSFPEWGLGDGAPDDAAYVAAMGQMFNANDFAFQSYFDTNGDGIASLGSGIPNATQAYSKAF